MKLQENFLIELLGWCFRKKDMVEICLNSLQFQYLPKEAYKHIWKSIKNHYETTSTLPTIGIVAQQFSDKKEIIEELNKIRQVELGEISSIIEQFEEFIKDCHFLEFYEKVGDSYNKGDVVRVRQLVKETGEFLVNFSTKRNSSYYERIFENFENRTRQRILLDKQQLSRRRHPFFIDSVDELIHGGVDKGDIWLGLGQSGVGKSKLIKWKGVNNARIGHRVLHIQAEGTKAEALSLYDSTWSGQLLYEVESGFIKPDRQQKLRKAIGDILHMGGEIYVYAAEQFDTLSMKDIRNIVIDVSKTYGRLDCIYIDYLDVIEPGDDKKYSVSEERQKRIAVAQKLKNICVEFDLEGGTCTQASSVDPLKLSNPEFYMTRYDISESKALLQPFSYFFTMNQTPDEYDRGIMRLYFDKVRKYKGGVLIPIAQAYEYEKFYDRKRTLELFCK